MFNFKSFFRSALIISIIALLGLFFIANPEPVRAFDIDELKSKIQSLQQRVKQLQQRVEESKKNNQKESQQSKNID